MRIRAGTLLALSCALVAQPAAAQALIEPEWQVEDKDGSCVVIGHLPEGGTVTKLRMAIPFDHRAVDGIAIFVAEDATEAPADAMLGVNGNPPLNAELTWSAVREAPNAFIKLDGREELGEAMRSGTPAVLRVGGEIISLQSVAEPIGEGRECVRTIFANAGIELDDYPGVRELRRVKHKELKRKFRLGRHSAKMENSIIGLFTASDYPGTAYGRGEEGSVRAALMINEKGKVEECVVLVSAGETLDETTCKILKSRGRFSATVDDDGDPVPSVFVTPMIRWSLPFGN